MKIFITGTDTNIGKTLISAWLCLHSKYDYFKPIQSGSIDGTDSQFVKKISNHTKIHKENFVYKNPLSPHLASKIEGDYIDGEQIILPDVKNLIVEGAGGLMVPINDRILIIDLIKSMNMPVILVSFSRLGTINHTLLSINALKQYGINIFGVIMNGIKEDNLDCDNCKAIEKYGNIPIIARLPILKKIDKITLSKIYLSDTLKDIMF
jgi:dethiobiotin synthetase